jgi:antitoxin HicB
MTNNSHIGSSLDDLLEEDGILSEVSVIALKRILAWKISQEMSKKGLSNDALG